jgi:hypothetical protein
VNSEKILNLLAILYTTPVLASSENLSKDLTNGR